MKKKYWNRDEVTTAVSNYIIWRKINGSIASPYHKYLLEVNRKTKQIEVAGDRVEGKYDQRTNFEEIKIKKRKS